MVIIRHSLQQAVTLLNSLRAALGAGLNLACFIDPAARRQQHGAAAHSSGLELGDTDVAATESSRVMPRLKRVAHDP